MTENPKKTVGMAFSEDYLKQQQASQDTLGLTCEVCNFLVSQRKPGEK
jgi:hypothetical protein